MDTHDIRKDNNMDQNISMDQNMNINIEGTAKNSACARQALARRLLSYVDCHWEEAEPLSVSTFDTRKITLDGKDYVVKRQRLDERNLSPFWRMMREVFGSDFAGQRAAMPKICSLLEGNPHIPPARLVLTDEARRLLIYEKMEGQPWEPDIFPDDPWICRQLGQFIGWNHSHTFPACGLPDKTDKAGKAGKTGGMDITDVERRLLNYVTRNSILHLPNKLLEELSVELSGLRSVKLPGLHSVELSRLRSIELSEERPANSAGECSVKYIGEQFVEGISYSGSKRYALIMTDISANQFVFGPGRIQACVDLDAYVIGPVEWELAVLANCVPNWEAFRMGYEEYCRLPKLDAVAKLFGWLMR